MKMKSSSRGAGGTGPGIGSVGWVCFFGLKNENIFRRRCASLSGIPEKLDCFSTFLSYTVVLTYQWLIFEPMMATLWLNFTKLG
jgi:hypothetical protein